MPRSIKLGAWLSCLVVLVDACGGTPEPSPSAALLASAPTPSITAAASTDPDEVAKWVQFRQRYGLRFDLPWITQVAMDPANISEIGVPLTPAEMDLVATLNQSAQNLAPPLTRYGEGFPGEFAGVFIDGTKVVIRFTGRLEEHRAEITTLFGKTAPIEVRGTTRTVHELEDLSEQVEAERAWFPSIGAELFGASPSELDNKVRIRYIAKNESVEPLIRAHFDNPDWIVLKWYGPPPWTGPEGTLRVIVVDRDGRPVDAEVYPVPLDRAVSDAHLPFQIGRDGTADFTVPAIDWEIWISFQNRKDENIDVKRRVHVSGDRTTSVTVVVDR